ncbi:hypothetical protein ES705_47897 [subsurface metagenome]
MTGLEYTDRLIEDINTTAATRTQVPDPFTQVRMVGLTGQTNLKNFWAALNVWDADAHLDILSQFLNINERLVDHNKGDRIDIRIFQRDVTAQREKVSEVFKQILDNNQLVDLVTRRPFSEFLIEQLDWIHQAAN